MYNIVEALPNIKIILLIYFTYLLYLSIYLIYIFIYFTDMTMIIVMFNVSYQLDHQSYYWQLYLELNKQIRFNVIFV